MNERQVPRMDLHDAREILRRHNIRVECPVQGDDAADDYEQTNPILAAAALTVGSAKCLGHNRAARMEARSEQIIVQYIATQKGA
jgi:hypothetical protein